MRSVDQVSRVLNLIPFLQANPGVSVESVASHLGISRAQVVKDLEVIWMCGLPGGLPGDLIEIDMDAVEGEGVIHLSNADYLTRPMRFTADEVFSLQVALSLLDNMATGEQKAVVTSTLAKLSQLAGSSAAAPVAVSITSGAEQVREVVTAAIEEGRRLRLDYDGANRGRTTTPQVDPVAVIVRDGVAYLRAWSLDRDDWRTYRLDRIAAAVEVGDSADHGELPAMTSGWFDEHAGTTDVVLDLEPSAAWVAEYDPVESVGVRGDHTIARMRVADPAWITRRLLALGTSASVVEPAGVGDLVVDLAHEALALQARVAADEADDLPAASGDSSVSSGDV